MNLLDILKPECIKVPLDNLEKRAAIDELIDLLADQYHLTQTEELKEAVWSREKTRTTGIGQGLAIPHGKSNVCKHLLLAIGKPSQPIEFQSIDKQPVKLIVLLVSPPDHTSEHIQALARISRLMTQDHFREFIYNAKSGDEIYKLFEEYESGGVRS